MKKTIAQHAKEYLVENGHNGVMWGDTWLLDAIADRCIHTNLTILHPLNRHTRILNALEKSSLFEKKVVIGKPGYRGNQTTRVFMIKVDKK
jgi:hypothetical protein